MTLYALEPPSRLDSRTLSERFAANRDLWNGDGLPWVRDDGGRAAAGYRGSARDCACRAVAIALDLPYQAVYDDILLMAERERPNARRRRSHPRTGVHHATMRRYLDVWGWRWVPTMTIGSGCRVHVRRGEIPETGPVILSLSRHYAAVVDGVVRDTHDPSREGTRCVYGMWLPPAV